MNARRLAFQRLFITSISLVALLSGVIAPMPVLASHTPDPANVTIAGSLQSELGCAADWDPACAITHLSYEAADGVWQGTWNVPTGSWEYKAALNDGWAESYGKNGTGDAVPGAHTKAALGQSCTERIRFVLHHDLQVSDGVQRRSSQRRCEVGRPKTDLNVQPQGEQAAQRSSQPEMGERGQHRGNGQPQHHRWKERRGRHVGLPTRLMMPPPRHTSP